jgi:hypothetical protein
MTLAQRAAYDAGKLFAGNEQRAMCYAA